MKIFAIGDVVSEIGCEYLRKVLPTFKRENKIDLVIANGENSAKGNGITPNSANYLYDSGVDIITTGNHSFRRKEIYEFYDKSESIIRPANYPENTTPGRGMCIYDMGRIQIAVINIMGNMYLENLECPFKTVDSLIKKADDLGVRIKIVDVHAEATSEKLALGYYLDGRASFVFGTHTHVLTADETIFPNGTGYITDIGMTGPINSILGVEKDIVIQKFITKMPAKFECAKGACKLNGIVFEVDEKTGKTINVKRIELKENNS